MYQLTFQQRCFSCKDFMSASNSPMTKGINVFVGSLKINFDLELPIKINDNVIT